MLCWWVGKKGEGVREKEEGEAGVEEKEKRKKRERGSERQMLFADY